MDSASIHAQRCAELASQIRPLFERAPATTEKIVAHALFMRSVDHFRASVLLGGQSLDVEALALVRGIPEAMFVIGALLKGFLTTEQFQRFDLAQKAKNAREMREFLEREAPPDLQQRMSDYGARHKGETDLRLQQLAKKLDLSESYDGYYRMFSHVATHPSLSAVQKYLEYGELGTSVRYPGVGFSEKEIVLIATSALLRLYACLEKWLGTTPVLNLAIRDALLEHEAFGPKESW
jgi:hypothetical protein